MYPIAGLALLLAVISEQLGQPDIYGANPKRRPRPDEYGADLISELKGLDGVIYDITRKFLGLVKGTALLKKKAMLTQISAQRDHLIASGQPPSSPNVANLNQQFRDIVASVIGLQLTEQIEHATAEMRAKRDALVQKIGTSIKDWSSYGGFYGVNLIENDQGQLLRSDLFGRLWATDTVEAFGASPIQRQDLFGGQDTWIDAWYGAARKWYGNEGENRLRTLSDEAVQITRKILGYRLPLRAPRLLSLNSKRDKLITAGIDPSAPKVQDIDQEEVEILVQAGMQLNGPEHQRLLQIQAERDELLKQRGTR